MKTRITTSPSLAIRLASLTKDLVLRLFLVSTLLYMTLAANAQVFRLWTGSASASWSNPNNWNPVGLPQAGEFLWFESGGNTSMINDIPNLIVNNLGFVERDWVLSGNPLTLGGPGGGGIVVASSRTDDSSFTTINCALIINANDCEFKCEAFDGSDGRLRLNADVNLNGFNLILSASSKSIAGLADGTGHIEMAGSISGNGNVTAMTSGYPDGTIQFLGTANNTFSGTLFIEPNVPSSADGVFFNKQVGSVANQRVVIEEAAWVNWRNSNQLGDNATVVVKDGSRLNLNGYHETIGNLIMTNVSADAQASLVNTESGGVFDPVGILTVNDGIITWVNNATVVPTIRGILNLPSGQHNFFVFAANYDGLNLEAQVTGLGGFTKYGNAALLLKGTNTFGDTVYGGSGIIDVHNPSGFGSPAGGVVLMGGSVTLRNLTVNNETLLVRGTGQITPETAGSLLTSFGVSGWTGAIELDTNLVVSFGDMILSGYISGPGGLALHSAGTVQIGGTFNNTYTGATLVRSPVVEFNKQNGAKAFAGPLVVGGAMGGPYEARWLASAQTTIPSVTLYANGLVNLNGFNDDFGPINFNGGTIATATGLLGINGLVTVNSVASASTISGRMYLPPGYREFLVHAGDSIVGDLAISATVSGPGHLQKTSFGEMRLSVSNSYSGLTLVDVGLLSISHPAALGSGDGGTIVADGATLQLHSLNGGIVRELISLRGHGFSFGFGALDVIGDATLRNQFPSIYACLDLTASATVSTIGSDTRLTADGFVSGSGPLIKTGPGSLVFSNSNPNTYVGDTLITAGTLELRKPNNTISIPGNLVVGPATVGSPAVARWYQTGGANANASITVNANSLLDLNGNNQTLAALNLNDGGDVQTGAGQLNFAGGRCSNRGHVECTASWPARQFLHQRQDRASGARLSHVQRRRLRPGAARARRGTGHPGAHQRRRQHHQKRGGLNVLERGEHLQ